MAFRAYVSSCQEGLAVFADADQYARLVKNRWLIVALALIAATLFAISVQMGKWWSVETVEIGPFGSKHCFGGDCKPAGLGWVNGTARWQRTGIGTWAGGLLSAFILSIMAAGVAAKRVPKLAARTALVSIGTTLTAGALFILQYPGVEGATPDRGLWTFAIAIVVGSAAAIKVHYAPPLPPKD